MSKMKQGPFPNKFMAGVSGGDVEPSPATGGLPPTHGLERPSVGGGKATSSANMPNTGGSKANSEGLNAVTGGGTLPKATHDKPSTGGSKAKGVDFHPGGSSLSMTDGIV